MSLTTQERDGLLASNLSVRAAIEAIEVRDVDVDSLLAQLAAANELNASLTTQLEASQASNVTLLEQLEDQDEEIVDLENSVAALNTRISQALAILQGF